MECIGVVNDKDINFHIHLKEIPSSYGRKEQKEWVKLERDARKDASI